MLPTLQKLSVLPGDSLAERTKRVFSSKALPNLGVPFGNLFLELYAV